MWRSVVGWMILVGTGSWTACATAVPNVPASSPLPANPNDDKQLPTVSAEAYRSVLEAELQLEAGNLPAAIQLLREAVLHDPASPYLHVRLAEAWLDSGDTDEARRAAEAALRLDARCVPALRALGAAALAAGETSDAKRAWAEALRAAPGDRETSLLLAELLVGEGELDEAERTVAALMEHEPGAVDGYLALARVFAERGEVERAFTHVARALAREADDADALAQKLGLLWALGRFEEALPVARSLAAAAGDGPSVRRDLLSAYAAAGLLDEARELAGAWLAEDSAEEMRLLVADAWERAGHPEEALAVLTPPSSGPLSARSAVEVARLSVARGDVHTAVRAVCPVAAEPGASGPTAVVTASACARALVRAGRSAEAAKLLDERLATLGRAPRLLDAFALVASGGGAQPERALAAARAALLENPSDARVVEAVARVHTRLGDVAGARRAFDEALRASPSDPELLFALARHLEEQGEPLAAVDVVERLVERGHRGPEEFNFLAFTLAEAERRPEDARRYAWRAVVADPLNGYVVDTLGWCEFAAGRMDPAIAALRRADRLSPGEAEILFHLASAEERRGEHKAARANAERALVLVERDPEQAVLRKKVELLLSRLRKSTE